jgi:hypothetical protein
MLASEVDRAGNKLFADTPSTMMRRDDKSGDPTNGRAGWKIGDEFGTNQSDNLARELCKEKAATLAMQRATQPIADIRLF